MRLALLAAACLLAMACSGATASAATGPCGQGSAAPTCHIWNGKVTFIGDGDTVSVKLDEQKPKDAPVRVRITGIQAMEEHVYTSNPADRTGECHAGEATARLEYLVGLSKGRVQLAALDPASHSGSRARRQVRVNINGTWRDAGRIMIGEGLVLPLANHSEWLFDTSYRILAQRAAQQQLGMFNSYWCGPGPEDLASLRVWVRANPAGNDRRDPNGEWLKVKNLDPLKPVALGGWWIRDSDLRRYTLPASAVVPAGGSITVFVGSGSETATEFYWGLRGGIFDNVSGDGHGGGDGGFLFDPEGDLRAWMMYPCLSHCVDPLQRAVKVGVHPTGTEYVTFENVTSGPIDLEGYRFASGKFSYPFPSGTILQAGDVLRVNVKGDPAEDTTLVKGWGLDSLIFPNDGGSGQAETFDDIRLDCDAWGTGSCG
jgi:endonuclease YncB( thermonuclease family)